MGMRTWIQINKPSLIGNMKTLRGLLSAKSRFMAVIKSNAYGHGLVTVAKILNSDKEFQSRGWFGVDSIVEALRLRREGIKNDILVLGSTLPENMKEAADRRIILSISTFEALKAASTAKARIHLKFDSGMHRQGFLPAQTPRLINELKRLQITPEGIFTHFASAKDPAYPTYTLSQIDKFKKALRLFKQGGFKNLIQHAAASGGGLLFPESHFDMVRFGIALYGYFPSLEAQIALQHKLRLRPVLEWCAKVTEVKEIPAGSYIGYDLTQKVSRKTRLAIIPVGYWHGYDRGLSSCGEVLIRGVRRCVLGRVSMDMIAVDVSAGKVAVGDIAVLIGRQGKEVVWANDLALKINSSPYEVLTRTNPLIKRITV